MHPAFMSGDTVQIAAAADEGSLAAGLQLALTGIHAEDRHVTVEASSIGIGTRYWRICAVDGIAAIYCSETRSLSVSLAPPGFDPLAVDECDDGYNNDEDWLRDERDPGCRDDTPLTEYTTSTPTYARRDAVSDTRLALGLEFGNTFDNAYSRHVRCRRGGKTRFTCRVSWVIGDLGFVGRVEVREVWNPHYPEYVPIRYSMRVSYLNEYCAYTGGSHCVKKYRRRGRI